MPADAEPARPRSWRRVALLAFCLYHLGAITVGNVTKETAWGRAMHRPFAAYNRATALWQGWDMFTTAPHYRHVEAVLVARDAGGRESVYDPMLPGLRPYPDLPRIHGLFLRMTFTRPGFRQELDRYAFAACRAIQAKAGVLPSSVHIALTTDRLRSLARIREDGTISDIERVRSEERPCLP